MIRILDKALRLTPDPATSLKARIRQRQAEGEDVVSLLLDGLEAPAPAISTDENWPPRPPEALTPPGGSPQLRQRLSARYDQPYDEREILVGPSAGWLLGTALQCLAGPGDAVAFLSPHPPAFTGLTEFAGAAPRPCDVRFAPFSSADAASLDAALASPARVVLLGHPRPLAGTVETAASLGRLARTLDAHPEITIISLDAGARLGGGGPHLLDVAPSLRPRTLRIDSLVHDWGLGGTGLAWTAGPRPLISALTRIQSQQAAVASAAEEAQALALLDRASEHLPAWRAQLDQRRHFAVGRLGGVPHLRAHATGGFGVWIDVSHYLGRSPGDGPPLRHAGALAGHLLHSHKVATLTGVPCGLSDHLWLSVGVPLNTLAEGITRIRDGLAALA